MTRIPLVVGFGGINAAGRSSNHQSYRRLVFDALPFSSQQECLASLAALSGRVRKAGSGWVNDGGENIEVDEFLSNHRSDILKTSLIRELENTLFDPSQIYTHKKTELSATQSGPMSFKIKTKDLSHPLPENWTVLSQHEGHSVIEIVDSMDVLLPQSRVSAINSAGQLPSGFEPSTLYASRNHPRGLQLTVFAASDAFNSMGIEWDDVQRIVAPDQISVYAGSGLSQLDYNGNGGLLQARLLGKKVSSKQIALGYAEMPADFINAYLIGNLGTTGTNVAACATFLYNLRQGIKDIQSGESRVAIIATSEAPLLPEVFEGFATMGALADDESLRKLDGLSPGQDINFNRACRPFGVNAGFTLSESAQAVILFDDELTLELGAQIFGAVNDVFINADGFKKSIASPGLGNYLSMAKAASSTASIIGDKALQQRSYVQSHGTGTPQNRQTESKVLNDTAKRFGISHWPIVAIKSYVGHSLASSAGDQLAATLGFWKEGILPGILTVDEIAEDVAQSNIDFQLQHNPMGVDAIDATLINSKGFGGNNASASILSPNIAEKLLNNKHGKKAMSAYRAIREKVEANAAENEKRVMEGENRSIYKFDNNVLDGDALTLKNKALSIDTFSKSVSIDIKSPYAQYAKDSDYEM